MKPCELCDGDGGEVLHRTEKFRVVLIDDIQYPGFCRVIWNEHVKEMTDLYVNDRSIFMQAVCKVESAIRAVMQPEKINLASFGNMTPHLHWHVIPRYLDDVHFPNPVWGAITHAEPAALAQRRTLLPVLKTAIHNSFSSFI